MTKRVKIDDKRIADTVHATGPTVDCFSKKNGPLMTLAVIP